MLSRKIPLDTAPLHVASTYASRGLTSAVPRLVLPEVSMDPRAAYQLIHDELALDANPDLNLATFVTTYMDDEAGRLMSESANKNAIDWDEYPQTVALQDRCVNMLSRLFGADEHHDGVGTATVGSSEAIHLAGLAMKFRWRNARKAAGLPSDRPNIVMGANVQVCWEKFARYFDVEPRYVPLTMTRYIIGVDEAMALVDENTIGVVGILGSTYTGEYEPIAALDAALTALCEKNGGAAGDGNGWVWDVPLHVDAASGGFVAPFLTPELLWDFRLPRVHSINVSGHKYGLVYPGVGWVLWRDAAALPAELIFNVNYLGGLMPTFALNFSRPGSEVVAQYYTFFRLGRSGYRAVQQASRDVAMFLSAEIEGLGPFTLISRGDQLPVFAFTTKPEVVGWDVFAVSRLLRERGWQVPAYTFPENRQDLAVLRVVCRNGFSHDLAQMFLSDLKAAMSELEDRKLNAPISGPSGFRH